MLKKVLDNLMIHRDEIKVLLLPHLTHDFVSKTYYLSMKLRDQGFITRMRERASLYLILNCYIEVETYNKLDLEYRQLLKPTFKAYKVLYMLGSKINRENLICKYLNI